MYQIRGQPGHRPQELLFTMKSIIARYLDQGKMIILQSYDISSFFDQEQLLDVMDTLHKLSVDPRLYKCWYRLNESTRIQVGESARVQVEESIRV